MKAVTSHSLGTALAGALMLAGLGVFVLAAIPDSQGVIRGCYKTANGQLRVLDGGAGSKGDETPIPWNQAGPQAFRESPGRPGQRGRPARRDPRALRAKPAREGSSP